jgi:anti-anti-sigma factor
MIVAITFDAVQNAWIVTLEGELDVYNVSQMTEGVQKKLDDKLAKIIFDCAKLDYIDSTGLGALVKLYKIVKYYGGGKLAKLRKHLSKVVYITELDKLFEIEVA